MEKVNNVEYVFDCRIVGSENRKAIIKFAEENKYSLFEKDAPCPIGYPGDYLVLVAPYRLDILWKLDSLVSLRLSDCLQIRVNGKEISIDDVFEKPLKDSEKPVLYEAVGARG